MPKKPLKTLIAEYVKSKYPNWVHKGELGRLAVIEWGYENENMGRRCRELADEGTFERRMNGKSVEYRFKEKESQPERNPSNYRCSKCNKDAVTLGNNLPFCQKHLVNSSTLASLF